MSTSLAHLPVAVLGAGPVGLAAAAELVERRQAFFILEAAGHVGANLRDYGHVRLFSPWKYDVAPAVARLLEPTGWRAPQADALPLAREVVDHVLQPFAALPAVASALQLRTRVVALSREGFDKVKGKGRESVPFVVRAVRDGRPIELRARAVIDGTGTWNTPNPVGASGLPAHGEREHAGRIHYGIPDVAGARRRMGSPTMIAELIRRQVRQRFGITCSVGVAATKFVAKLASGHAKPDGVLLIPRAATVDFLRVLPVGALWGVGERTEAALARWGITTVAQLADSDVGTVQRAVGKVAGAHLHDLAWGRDPRPVHPGREEKSIGAEETFGEDVADPAVVQAKALQLADRCAERLRRHGLVARTVAVKVRASDFRTLTRARTLATPTDVGREIYLAARELLAGVDLDGLPVRLVGVRAEGLSSAELTVRQPTLEEATADDGRDRREAERAMDEVRRKFGSDAIRPASAPAGRDRSTTTFVPADLS